ncbi:hypothetical protein QJS83_14565 [Bdellovibrio sp. 22V]|uniref:hypothetical protein n=1 Tax=Bdellovibrio TaxID=958 RepID=UPI002543ECAC|nr:hypothetical protein [Bdellovibrio sp. 22V]WII71689.1 hypothetical protein QJS83_14565 [Bdellovibrio sp. 22V]
MFSTPRWPLTALTVALILIALAEVHSESHFLREEIFVRLQFRKAVRRVMENAQETLQNPQTCRKLLRPARGLSLLYDGKEQKQNQDPRYQLKYEKDGPFQRKFSVSRLFLRSLWLDAETSRSLTHKLDGQIYTLHRTHLIFDIASLKAEHIQELATVPLTITTGPGSSPQVIDCYSSSIYP